MIRIAIAGLGNCASMLVQGIEYYKQKGENYTEGLITPIIGGYRITDIQIVAAFDVSRNKIGKDVSEAIFEKPNITPKIVEMPKLGVKVSKGPVFDGVAKHMLDVFNPVYDGKIEGVIQELKDAKADVLINLLPSTWAYTHVANHLLSYIQLKSVFHDSDRNLQDNVMPSAENTMAKINRYVKSSRRLCPATPSNNCLFMSFT